MHQVLCHALVHFDMRRFDDHVLERPDYFPMWAHKLKTKEEYEACFKGQCRGEPDGTNHMPKFPEVHDKMTTHSDVVYVKVYPSNFYTLLQCLFVCFVSF